MPELKSYDKENYGVLFASSNMDATVKTGTGTLLQPGTDLRTIIIGIGGTGVQTISKIKSVVQKRMNPTWKSYVGFLGIDASWSEIRNDQNLDPGAETVITTQTGIDDRMGDPKKYPSAVRRFMLDGSPNLGRLETDGSGMSRLIGKIKIHDQDAGNPGIDEIIVSKIKYCIANLAILPPPAPGTAAGFYDVYVIGSGSGGTGSGGFLEMPALIRRAMGDNPVHIHGILYLPDALSGLVKGDTSKLSANGYATLKELNYYQGLYMRSGYADTWTYSSAAQPEIKLDSKMGFFDIPYLIGSPAVNAANAAAVAQNAIAEFLISMLVKETPVPGVNPFLSSAFYSNATAPGPRGNKAVNPGNPNLEAAGTAHEFPKCFASIGFAEASAPKKLIRAYAVKETCQKAGLKPVDAAERVKLAANLKDGMVLPFRDRKDLMSATDGTAKAKELLKPLNPLLRVINNGSFDFMKDVVVDGATIDCKTIHETYSGTVTAQKIERLIEECSGAKALEKLEGYITDQYTAYRENVRQFVAVEGPYAFYNLYYGNFQPEGTDHGTGIRDMLQNLTVGKHMNGAVEPTAHVDDAKEALQNATSNIGTAGLFNRAFNGHQLVQKWLDAQNDLAIQKINEKREKAAFGTAGYVMKCLMSPAELLADQLATFGDVLSTLSDIYQPFGNAMDSFDTFASATESEVDVNLGGLQQGSYQWLKNQADAAVNLVQIRQFRTGLVDSFFANPLDWLSIPEERVIHLDDDTVGLASVEKPAPAREKFDDYVSAQINLDAAIDVSILSLFQREAANGTSFDVIAQNILNKLNAVSQVRFNGATDSRYVHKYIKYPNSLITAGGDGPAIANAISNAATLLGVNAYPSNDTNCIQFYQQATNLEVYRVNGLKEWEAQYNVYLNSSLGGLLHGKSPDVEKVVDDMGNVTYKEYQRWEDYPSICLWDHPERPDPATGEICREGRMRIQVREMLDHALKLGVVYMKQKGGGYQLYRVHCDKSVDWKFNITKCAPDPVTGLLPQGETLAVTVAQQNGTTRDAISCAIKIDSANLFSKPAANEEFAYEYAVRVLRAHHPMLCEIRQTCKLFEVWDKMVEEFNIVVLRRRRPAMMTYMLKACLLTREADGSWVWHKEDGTTEIIANYTPTMLSFFPPQEQYDLSNGLMAYSVFQNLDEALPGDRLVQEYKRAKDIYNGWRKQGDTLMLNEGQAMVDLVEKERQELLAKGGNNGDKPFNSAFVTAMAGFNRSTDQLTQIEQFYYQTTLWGTL